MIQGKRVALIGAGNMGEVLTKALVESCGVSPEQITVSDVNSEQLERFSSRYGVITMASNIDAASGADLLILAVKPQVMDLVLRDLASTPPVGLVLSVAAGISCATIEDILGRDCRVVRVMPNTPALVGEGVSAISAGANCTDEDLELTRTVFEALGLAVQVDESLMDAVTGLSGSGPAYCFVIIEGLTDAGVRMGLPRDMALKMAAQTMLGAAALCLRDGRTPSQLKDMVTSPGGTTIEGIKALEKGRIRATLMDAVEASALRSKAMGKREG